MLNDLVRKCATTRNKFQKLIGEETFQKFENMAIDFDTEVWIALSNWLKAMDKLIDEAIAIKRK